MRAEKEEYMKRIEGTRLELEYRKAAEKTVSLLEQIITQAEEKEGRKVADELTYRIKTSESIEKKLRRKKYGTDLDTAVLKLNDIAGVRCVCAYIDDLYQLEKRLKQQEEIRVVKEKDFIRKPKKSGYRSLHLIIEVPVEGEGKIIYRKTEVQFRTQIMHLWARLDHNSIYKSENKENRKLQKMLKACARLGNEMDQKVSEIRKGTG